MQWDRSIPASSLTGSIMAGTLEMWEKMTQRTREPYCDKAACSGFAYAM